MHAETRHVRAESSRAVRPDDFVDGALDEFSTRLIRVRVTRPRREHVRDERQLTCLSLSSTPDDVTRETMKRFHRETFAVRLRRALRERAPFARSKRHPARVNQRVANVVIVVVVTVTERFPRHASSRVSLLIRAPRLGRGKDDVVLLAANEDVPVIARDARRRTLDASQQSRRVQRARLELCLLYTSPSPRDS